MALRLMQLINRILGQKRFLVLQFDVDIILPREQWCDRINLKARVVFVYAISDLWKLIYSYHFWILNSSRVTNLSFLGRVFLFLVNILHGSDSDQLHLVNKAANSPRIESNSTLILIYPYLKIQITYSIFNIHT